MRSSKLRAAIATALLCAASPGVALPCTPISGVTLIAPSRGPVPLETHVRIEAQGSPNAFDEVALVAEDETRYVMQAVSTQDSGSPHRGDRFVYAPPENLPAGDYSIELTFDQQTEVEGPVTFEGDGSGLTLSGQPTLSSLEVFRDEADSGGYECSWTAHMIAAATFTLPPAPSGGWIAEAIERSSGEYLAWAELQPEQSQLRTTYGEPVSEADEACFTLKLYDFRNDLVQTVDFPCQPLEENGGDDDDSQGDDDDTSGDGDDDGGWGCRWMHHERGGTTAGAFGVFLVMLGLVRRRRG